MRGSTSQMTAAFIRERSTCGAALVLSRDGPEVDAQRSQLPVKVRTLHADAFREPAHLAVAQHQLLLQVGAFEVLACLPERQRQQVLLDQRLIGRCAGADLRLDLLERDVALGVRQQEPANKILEFAHIIRPWIVSEAVLRRYAEAPKRNAL